MDYKDYLDTTVLQEKKTVTYRSLARNLNIHINTAKQALYHYSTVESSVTAIFCLTGTLADNSFSIRLVNQDELEETKKQYHEVSGIHVYGILPCRPKDFSVLVAANKDMISVSVDDRIKNGLIFNSSVKMYIPEKSSIPAPAPSSSNAPTSSTSTSTKNTTEKKSIFGSMPTNKPAATTTTKPETTSSSITPAKRKGTLSFDKATPKAAKKQENEKPKSTPPATTTQRKVRTIQVSDDDESEEDEEALDERLARSAKIQVNDIFSDDEENEEQKPNDDKDSTAAPSPSMDVDTDTGGADNKSEDSSDKMDLDETNSDQEKETTPGKVRRKVQKKKTYKNERGFIVTEDVWEWEEVDAEIPTNKKTTKATESSTPKGTASSPSSSAKKASATPKTAPGNQKSLLSFWGKR